MNKEYLEERVDLKRRQFLAYAKDCGVKTMAGVGLGLISASAVVFADENDRRDVKEAVNELQKDGTNFNPAINDCLDNVSRSSDSCLAPHKDAVRNLIVSRRGLLYETGKTVTEGVGAVGFLGSLVTLTFGIADGIGASDELRDGIKARIELKSLNRESGKK